MHQKPILTLALSVFVLAIVAAGVFVAYAVGGGFKHGFSSDAGDWSAFGSYFGGVFGSIVGFGTLVFVVVAFLQHEFNAVRTFNENLKQSHLRMLETIHDDVRFVLERELRDDGGSQKFGDYVVGVSASTVDAQLFSRLTSRLLEYVAHYCEALHLYRDNIDANFEDKAHYSRARHLLQFLEEHRDRLEGTEPITLRQAHMNLHGSPLRGSPPDRLPLPVSPANAGSQPNQHPADHQS